MAKEDEVWRATRCLTGAVPPFGRVFERVTGVKVLTVVDESLIQQGATINFNGGLRTESLGMATADFLRFEEAEVVNICVPRGSGGGSGGKACGDK
jgi:prolyl-tRNA editing enzyme YbaK/EbsC (Cys-tRNA(Pro) deacylase)